MSASIPMSFPASCRDSREFALLNDYQQRFPLCPAPFERIAAEQGLADGAVLAAYQGWQEAGVISRIGPVFAPNRVGSSTLAALAVPEQQLEAVAGIVSGYAEVNHNYEREHSWNLWFVATAPDAEHLRRVLDDMAAQTGCPLIALPMEAPYHIDLGFDLAARPASPSAPAAPVAPAVPGEAPPSSVLPDSRVLAALQAGLPLVERPYEALGKQLGLDGDEVAAHLENWLDAGILKRFGVVVRHHELGFRANAMCVWDVPDEDVDRLGRELALEPGVTLCYRRRRSLPDWPYNLYCMIHGRDRQPVIERREAIAARLGLDRHPHEMLFSCRRFKQRGAHYRPSHPEASLV